MIPPRNISSIYAFGPYLMILVLPQNWDFETHRFCTHHLLSIWLASRPIPLTTLLLSLPHLWAMLGLFRAFLSLPLVCFYCLPSPPFSFVSLSPLLIVLQPSQHTITSIPWSQCTFLPSVASPLFHSKCPSEDFASPLQRLSWPSGSQGFLHFLHLQCLYHGLSFSWNNLILPCGSSYSFFF